MIEHTFVKLDMEHIDGVWYAHNPDFRVHIQHEYPAEAIALLLEAVALEVRIVAFETKRDGN